MKENYIDGEREKMRCRIGKKIGLKESIYNGEHWDTGTFEGMDVSCGRKSGTQASGN